MKNKIAVVITCLLSITFISDAFAARQWNFQRVVDSQGNPIGGGNTAIGMRSGSTWPVVASNQGTAAMVPGGWVRTTSGLGMPPEHIDGATSNDGQSVAFAGSNGEVLTLGPSGWNRSILGGFVWKPSVAFTQDNKPAVLTNSGNGLTLSVRNSGQWYSSSLGPTTIAAGPFALDYDSYNQANVVFAHGSGPFTYGTKGALTGNEWNYIQPANFLPPINGPLDLALNSNDVPFVTYHSYSMGLVCATYNRAQGQWTSSIINSSAIFYYTMTCDSQGGIGIAYVADWLGVPTIGFNYINGDNSWSTESLWTAMTVPPLMQDSSIGLAFDAENNPVISYNAGNEVWIAYDPIVIPEPATLMLLLLGSAAGLCNCKSR